MFFLVYGLERLELFQTTSTGANAGTGTGIVPNSLFRKESLKPVGFDEKSHSNWMSKMTKKLDEEKTKSMKDNRLNSLKDGDANCCRLLSLFDPGHTYCIQDRLGIWRLTTAGRATEGLKDVNPLGMYLGNYENCNGSGSYNECGFRVIPLGDNLYNIETADNKGILGVHGKNANNRISDKNPIYVYNKGHYKIAGYGVSDETTFKILPNGNGLWRILTGDESGTLVFYAYHQHVNRYQNRQSGDNNNLPVYALPIPYENIVMYDGQFRLTRIS